MIASMMKKLADSEAADSAGNRLRAQRFKHFRSLLDRVSKPVRILDVGGTENFWLKMGVTESDKISIVLTNIRAERKASVCPYVERQVGDGRAMPQFDDKSFDIVFSNSVIEHVGTADDQRCMADEVRRIGKRYYLQTPNHYFPIEPHFLVPGWQFLPEDTRVWLLRHFRIGWYPRIRDPQQARDAVREIRLLARRELVDLFPGASMYNEKFAGMTKSFTVYDGF